MSPKVYKYLTVLIYYIKIMTYEEGLLNYHFAVLTY